MARATSLLVQRPHQQGGSAGASDLHLTCESLVAKTSTRMAFVQRCSLAHAHESGIWTCAWSPAHGGQLVTGGNDEKVRCFAAGNGRVERVSKYEGHELGVTSVTVSADGTLAASSSLDSTIRIIDLEHSEELKTIDAGPVEAFTVALSSTGRYIASGTQGGSVNLFSVSTGGCDSTLSTPGKSFAMSVAISPDAKLVACGHADGAIHVLDVEKQAVLARLDGHTASVRSLAFSTDGGNLISGSDDALANLYDVRSLTPVAAFQGHASWVLGAAFSPDGSLVASCSADRSVRIWDVANRTCLQSLPDCHQEMAWSVAFDPGSSKRFASVGDDGAVCVYEANGA